MSTKKFTVLYVIKLKLAHLFALCKTTIEIALNMHPALGEIAATAFDRLETANAELDRHMKQPLASLLTPELSKLDKLRDQTWNELKKNVKTAAGSVLATTNQAGKALLNFLTPYLNMAGQALNTETELIEEVLQRYRENEKLQQQSNAIGIVPLWEELERLNAQFDTMYKERNAELAAQSELSASKLKTNVANCYTQFCTAVEQQVNLMPGEDILRLFNEMDELRKKYTQL